MGGLFRNKGEKLCRAAFAGHDKKVQALLAAGADAKSAQWDGKTALQHGLHYPKVSALLIEAGGLLPGDPVIVDAGNVNEIETLKSLLAAGADVNTTDKNGKTPLHEATATDYYLEHLQLLLSHGANIDAQDQDGDTALMDACYRGSHGAALLLLAHGANVTLADTYGRTALCKLLWNARSHTLMESLLETGATAGKTGKELLDWLSAGGPASIANNQTKVQDSFVVVVANLLHAGSPVAAVREQAPSALFFALQSNLPMPIIQLLVDHHPDVSREEEAVVAAARHSDVAPLQLLLTSGCNIEAREEEQSQSALIAASQLGLVAHIRCLIENGADLNAQDCEHKTPIIYSIESGERQAIQLLLDAGADVSLLDESNGNALHALLWAARGAFLGNEDDPEPLRWTGEDILLPTWYLPLLDKVIDKGAMRSTNIDEILVLTEKLQLPPLVAAHLQQKAKRA